MYPISASQIRAARALLGWSQDDLADASHVSRGTIKTIENGSSVRIDKIGLIHRTLQDQGIEFLDGDGVRRQPDGLKSFSGPDSCDQFFDDVQGILKEKGGQFICSIQEQDMLTKVTCSTRRSNLERLEQVQKMTDVKCIFSDNTITVPFMPSFPIRVLPEESSIIPSSTFCYGDQLGIGFYNNSMYYTFVVFQQISFMRHFQKYFLPRWQIAKPLLMSVEPKKRLAYV